MWMLNPSQKPPMVSMNTPHGDTLNGYPLLNVPTGICCSVSPPLIHHSSTISTPSVIEISQSGSITPTSFISRPMISAAIRTLIFTLINPSITTNSPTNGSLSTTVTPVPKVKSSTISNSKILNTEEKCHVCISHQTKLTSVSPKMNSTTPGTEKLNTFKLRSEREHSELRISKNS